MKFISDKILKEYNDWLVSSNNPDFNGTQKYSQYDYYFNRLIEKALELGLINESEISILDINWLNKFHRIYETSSSLQDIDRRVIGHLGGIASLKKFINFIIYKNGSYERDFELYLEDCAIENGKPNSVFLEYKTALVYWWEHEAKQFSKKRNLFEYADDIEFNYLVGKSWRGNDPNIQQGIKLYTNLLSQIKFKKLLEWFVNQIKINNDIVDGYKTSGKGYAHDKIRDSYSKWRAYINFDLDCTLRCDFAKDKPGANYIHLANARINIQPLFVKVEGKSDVTALNIVVKNSSNDVVNYISEKSITALGLFDGSYPNAALRTFFADYRKEILNVKKVNEAVVSKEKGDIEDMDVENENICELNLILYGPPGTGKTYNTVKRAVAIIEQGQFEDNGYNSIKARYDQYLREGRILFTTFHQSYGYEEFIEGIKPDFDAEEIKYKRADGVFKAFCDKARKLKNDITQYGTDEFSTVWKISLGRDEDKDIKKDCFDRERIRLGWADDCKEIADETDYNGGGKSIVNAFIFKMKKGDIVLSRSSTTTIDAIGVILEDECRWDESYSRYKRYRKVKWLRKNINIDIKQINNNNKMVQSAVYKLNVTVDNVLTMLNHNQNGVSVEDYDYSLPYVFIIDEINRGNVSKIFGELITLIEPTKRLGADEEMRCILPYSGVEFGVPKNVYIIGTMNTADRSLVQLDAALRRRFAFEEMMPKSELLNVTNDGVDLNRLLTSINERITALLDREHQIGHSYFMNVQNTSDLSTVFKQKIIPLLQEYFFDDYESIKKVLSEDFIEKRDNPFDNGKKLYNIITEMPLEPSKYQGIYLGIDKTERE